MLWQLFLQLEAPFHLVGREVLCTRRLLRLLLFILFLLLRTVLLNPLDQLKDLVLVQVHEGVHGFIRITVVQLQLWDHWVLERLRRGADANFRLQLGFLVVLCDRILLFLGDDLLLERNLFVIVY